MQQMMYTPRCELHCCGTCGEDLMANHYTTAQHSMHPAKPLCNPTQFTRQQHARNTAQRNTTSSNTASHAPTVPLIICAAQVQYHSVLPDGELSPEDRTHTIERRKRGKKQIGTQSVLSPTFPLGSKEGFLKKKGAVRKVGTCLRS